MRRKTWLIWTWFGLVAVIGSGRANAVEVADERLTLTRSGSCSGTSRVSFGGRAAVIEGATIKSVEGVLLYAGTERVLDAASDQQTDFILHASAIVVRQGKRAERLPFGQAYNSGRLLFARPDLLVYYLTTPTDTLFFTQTPAAKRLYFAAGAEFVAARLDRYGNTVIALNDRLLSVNTRGQAVPLFRLPGETIQGLEILQADNGLLLGTQHGLLKIPANRKLYTLLVGAGRLEAVNGNYFWCEAGGERYALGGLGLAGRLESDKAYVRSLLAQGHKLIRLGLPEKAFQKYVKVLEIMPREPHAQRLVALLSRQLPRRQPAATQKAGA
jgi:hypothetical protein